ncbi:peptidyl-prolyl cis-trans isomerase [candidate division KSB1 bacterium]|nr:peptidyl-prolyl cis-trans isomerase [candidate division KSB1 bacterium]
MKRARLLSILALFVLFSNCGQHEEPQKIVASVGNEYLTIADIENLIPEDYHSKISLDQIKVYIDQWIDTRLIYEEAVKLGLHNLYKEELHRELKKVEIEYLAYKLIEDQINANIDIQEDKLQSFYEENKDSFIRENEEVWAYHILAADKEEADDFLKRLRSGESFEELCRQRAINSKRLLSNDGDLGYVGRDALPASLASDLFKLKKGSFSSPIKTDFGYHIFKLIDKQPKGSVRTLDEVRAKITEILKVEKRKEDYASFLAKLRAHAVEQKKLSLNLKLLKAFSPDTTESGSQ